VTAARSGWESAGPRCRSGYRLWRSAVFALMPGQEAEESRHKPAKLVVVGSSPILASRRPSASMKVVVGLLVMDQVDQVGLVSVTAGSWPRPSGVVV
jgi:hypothetical protein